MRQNQVVAVSEEADLDVVTALSGSGPAYVWELCLALLPHLQRIEFDGIGVAQAILDSAAFAMIQQGCELGLTREVATQLVVETFRGAVSYAMHSAGLAQPVSMAALADQVTSKGGTTAAARAVFRQDNLVGMVADEFSRNSGRPIFGQRALELVWMLAEQTADHCELFSASHDMVRPFYDVLGTAVSAAHAHARAGELGQQALSSVGVSTVTDVKDPTLPGVSTPILDSTQRREAMVAQSTLDPTQVSP